MSAKENKESYMQNIKDLNASKGDVKKIGSILEKSCVPGYTHHHHMRGEMNLDQTSQYYAELWSAFPDMELVIDDMVAEEDKLATRCTIQGTQKGAFIGIPATGKRGVITGMQFFKMAEGKFVEGWELPDAFSLGVQLGVIPYPASK